MTTPQCSNCFFSFVAPASAGTTANNRGAALSGLRFCNRQAPSADAQNPNGWLWPQVADDWWCGEGADSSTGLSYGDGVSGIPGTGGAGPGYLASSTTSLTIASSGSVAASTQLNLAYTPGARVRLTSTGSAAWMEGVVASYDASGLLTFTADLASGSGTHTDWSINVAGNPGAAGAGNTTWINAGPAEGADGDVNFTISGTTVQNIQKRIAGVWTTEGSGFVAA